MERNLANSAVRALPVHLSFLCRKHGCQ